MLANRPRCHETVMFPGYKTTSFIRQISMHILIIEDEPAIRDMIRLSLEQAGYQVSSCADAESARSAIREWKPDCLVVDWMLPGESGVGLIRWLRRQPGLKQVPTLMLTARAEENDTITGLDAGADDYMTKPLSLRELRARIKALLRRPPSWDDDRHLLRAGSLCLDTETRALTIDGEAVKLSKKEYLLLRFFLGHRDRVFSRDQILDAVWGNDRYLEDRTIDVHVLRLRKLLKPWGLDRCIQTVRGSGYRFHCATAEQPD